MMGLLDQSGLDSFAKSQRPDNHDSKSKSEMKEYADKKRNAKAHSFEIGDIVVHKWSRSNKYQSIFDPDCYTITKIDKSMITASRPNHSVTRNSFFFQSASLLGYKPVKRPEIERPAVNQFIIQRQPTEVESEPLTPVTGLPQQHVFDFLAEPPAAQVENRIEPTEIATLPAASTSAVQVAVPTATVQHNSAPVQKSTRSYAQVISLDKSAPNATAATKGKAPCKPRKLHFERQLAKDNEAVLLEPQKLTLRNRDIPK
jgi:hypothetical protein